MLKGGRVLKGKRERGERESESQIEVKTNLCMNIRAS